jgi:hypothetical protein
MSSWNLLMIGLFLSLEVLCGLARWSNGWHNWRLGGAIRGVVWSKIRSSKVVAPACRLSPASVRSKWTIIWNVLTHTGHMECLNWVASCDNELDDTLPRFMGEQWDSVWAAHGVSAEVYAWKTALGWDRNHPYFFITSWIVATRCALLPCVCRVVWFIPLQGWLLIWISATPSDMGDGLFTKSKLRIINFIILSW